MSQSVFDYNSNKEDAALNDDKGDFKSCAEDGDNDNDDDDKDDYDLIHSTARVSTSATFDCCHGDVDRVHVTL